MDILIIGLSYKSAEIKDREVISKKLLPPEARREFYEFLQNLKDKNGRKLIFESVALTTCNRSEFILGLPPKVGAAAGADIKNRIADYFFEGTESGLFYTYLNKDAVVHLFKVAASLDSMIIGEPQILGQIKDAYNEACEFKMTGSVLNKLFHKAFFSAKKVRTETKIASSPVSVSYAAVELSKKIFNNLKEKKVLLIGTGEMGKLTVRHFIKQGVSSVNIANRTKEKAVRFVEEVFEGEEKKYLTVVDFSEYYKLLPNMDIVICSTGSENYVIKYDDIMPVVKLRKQKPLFLIDISVPRNIDPEINKISNVYLFDIDDIGKMIESNLEVRKQEAEIALEIVAENADEFMNWKDSLNAVPIIVSLRDKVNNAIYAELSKYISEKAEKELIANSITNKILHEPITFIKKASSDFEGQMMLDTVRMLFNLNIGYDAAVNERGEKCKFAPTNENSGESRIKRVK